MHEAASQLIHFSYALLAHVLWVGLHQFWTRSRPSGLTILKIPCPPLPKPVRLKPPEALSQPPATAVRQTNIIINTRFYPTLKKKSLTQGKKQKKRSRGTHKRKSGACPHCGR